MTTIKLGARELRGLIEMISIARNSASQKKRGGEAWTRYETYAEDEFEAACKLVEDALDASDISWQSSMSAYDAVGGREPARDFVGGGGSHAGTSELKQQYIVRREDRRRALREIEQALSVEGWLMGAGYQTIGLSPNKSTSVAYEAPVIIVMTSIHKSIG